MITPKQVFDALPDNDLFSFDPPEEGESYRDYRNRIGDERLKEDSLFLFILIELCGEDIDGDEARSRLDRAIQDIRAVQDAVTSE